MMQFFYNLYLPCCQCMETYYFIMSPPYRNNVCIHRYIYIIAWCEVYVCVCACLLWSCDYLCANKWQISVLVHKSCWIALIPRKLWVDMGKINQRWNISISKRGLAFKNNISLFCFFCLRSQFLKLTHLHLLPYTLDELGFYLFR